jgi:hypothetical protein
MECRNTLMHPSPANRKIDIKGPEHTSEMPEPVFSIAAAADE